MDGKNNTGCAAYSAMGVRRLSAFTIIEVMISLAVLAMGIGVALSTIPTMHSVRKATSEKVRIQHVANAVTERLLSLPFDDLATTAVPWSMKGAVPVTFAELETANLVEARSNLRDAAPNNTLKAGQIPGVYIEFFRGVGWIQLDASGQIKVNLSTGYPIVDPTHPGLLDAGGTPTTWKATLPLARLVTDPLGVTKLSTYLADPSDSGAASRNPVIIRVRVISADGSIDIFTARTKGD